MHREPNQGPDSTAERTALWRAMHVQVDSPPHVFEDEIGLKLVAPAENWRNRQDMHPERTRRFRAAIVARARFVEDIVVEQTSRGVGQYVILGAGLDTFAQRRPEIASRIHLFEVDRPSPTDWKRQRLIELGLGVPAWLHLVPVDFEAGGSWLDRLAASGFDRASPAVVASTGVAMYLTSEVVKETFRQVATLAPGSTFAMTFMLPAEFLGPEDRPWFEWAKQGAEAAGTPFATAFAPEEMLALARQAGCKDVRHVSLATLAERYFAERTDGFRPSSGEDFLVASL